MSREKREVMNESEKQKKQNKEEMGQNLRNMEAFHVYTLKYT